VEEMRGHALVTANVIAPSTLDTEANRRAMPDADFGAWVTLDDVAASISKQRSGVETGTPTYKYVCRHARKNAKVLVENRAFVSHRATSAALG
jgi:hypothetical protein